jgi:orotate phosphoribosyltransferase
MSLKRYILSMIMEFAYRYDPLHKFTLSSGKVSDFYVDCQRVTMRGECMPHIVTLIENILIDEGCIRDIEAIGGMTMGADPIAAAYAYHFGINMFSVRKEPPSHGIQKKIEGSYLHGSKVVIVEDTVTTGKSTLYAIKACLEYNLKILGVISFVDRQEHDYKTLWREYLPENAFIRSIFTAEELKKAWNGSNPDGGGGGLIPKELVQVLKSTQKV